MGYLVKKVGRAAWGRAEGWRQPPRCPERGQYRLDLGPKPARGGTPMSSAGPRLSVLVVDDDPLIRRLLACTLPARGIRVWAAEGGAEAVRIYRDHQSEID